MNCPNCRKKMEAWETPRGWHWRCFLKDDRSGCGLSTPVSGSAEASAAAFDAICDPLRGREWPRCKVCKSGLHICLDADNTYAAWCKRACGMDKDRILARAPTLPALFAKLAEREEQPQMSDEEFEVAACDWMLFKAGRKPNSYLPAETVDRLLDEARRRAKEGK